MENNELQQSNITISGVEYLAWGLKIKDEKGLIYNVSKFLKGTETETVAYKTLSKLPQNGAGLVKCFKFAVADNSNGGQSRWVRIIEEPSNTLPKATQAPYTNENNKVVSDITKQRNFEAEAFGKCKHAFLVELLKKDWKLETAEKEAELWAKASMRVETKPEDFGDEVEASSIPF